MPRLFVLTILVTLASRAVAQDMPLSQVLIDDEPWQLLGEGYKFTEGPAADVNGNVYFTDVPESKIYRIDAATGKVTVFAENTAQTNGLMFGADGWLYGCRNGDKQIVAYKPDGSFKVIADDVQSNDLVVSRDGHIWFTDPPNKQVWHVAPDGKKRVVAGGFRPNGVILTPDEGTLVVTDSDQPHLWAFRVERDGNLKYQSPWYQPVRIPTGQDKPGSDGMTVDRDGRLYLASRAGIQVFDTTARPCGVILKPQNKSLSNLCFGGEKFDYLYVTCTDKVYRRRMKVPGLAPNSAIPSKK